MFPNVISKMPPMEEILALAKTLRKDGDQVLNGSSKLSLSTKLLHNLNNAFTLIIDEPEDLESSFQVCNNSEVDLFRDLKFLHDFVQKTVWLKVIHSNNDSRMSIDISKFRHLRYLELQKVNIDLVTGIQGVRGQLETIVCTGANGVGTIARLLATCGGDNGGAFVWASLKRLTLSYNGLGRLDKSLELAPWLQTLDLSHNFISMATELNYLPNLKYVNLSYNKLEAVPIFNKFTYRSLRVLVLKNNYIDNIDGLQGLDFLVELDLSFNCLSDHSLLWPIEVMTTLLWLNLTGNPLSYHERHRALTSKYLHSSLAENKFVLDHKLLSKSEKSVVTENRLFTIRTLPSSSKDNSSLFNNSVIPVTTSGPSTTLLTHNSITSQQYGMTQSTEKDILQSQRKTNLGEVNIADDIERLDDEISFDGSNKLTNSYYETSLDHLETKKKILALREKFGGEIWLSSHGGSFIQDIMGIETQSSQLNMTSALDADSSEADQLHSESELLNTNDEKQTEQLDVLEVMENDAEVQKNIEQSIKKVEHLMMEEQTMEIEKSSESNNYYDPNEEQGELFLVRKMRENEYDEMEELFLIITPEDIKERDAITGEIKYMWSRNTILSCSMGCEKLPTIIFMFDTIRRDRQCRTYYTESVSDANKIVKSVGNLMKTRPLMLKVYKCMKCSTHFSQDCDILLAVSNTTTSNPVPPMCPSCKTTLVIETDEFITPDNSNEDNDDINNDGESDDKKTTDEISTSLKNDLMKSHEGMTTLRHSTSQSSIGGTEDGAMSITTSITYFDSRHQAQVCCTATSLDDSRESTPSTGAAIKKCESDIEILSNPSQSSIEVLDDGSKSVLTPNRKRSSEERRIAIAPNLLTIPDTIPVMTGLTESSSSGSFTDSICTAYENKKIKTPKTSLKQEHVILESGKIESDENIKDPVYTPVANLGSMLGGLLQSMKIGNHRDSSKLEEGSDLICSDIQYSYTNFTSVDHRIKLHLILNVFELENEKLMLLLRCDIMMQNQSIPFPGCLVLSTSKMYVLRVIGIESEDPQRWLQKETSWTIDRLRSFAPLPCKQGVVVELEQPSKFSEESTNFIFLCILQDFQRTSNLLFYLTDLQLPESCEVVISTAEQYTTAIHNLMMTSTHYRNGDAVRIFALFSSASMQLEMHTVNLQISGLLVTTSSLILMDDKIHWLLPHSNESPTKLSEQAISNLIEVVLDGYSLALNFFDEIEGVEELWTLNYISSDAANSVITAIQAPWEELFSVPLQIINKIPIKQDTNQKS